MDAERAALLITRAADAGLEEAMEKLVSMYRSGDGVRRDYETAIRWQERLVELLRRRYEEDDTEEHGQGYLYGLLCLGDYVWEMRSAERAREIYVTAREFASELTERFHSVLCRQYLGTSYEMLGDICMAEEDLELAQEYYEEDMWIREALRQELCTAESQLDLCISYSQLGAVCMADGDLAKAREYYEAGLQISKALQKEKGTMKTWDYMSFFCTKLGSVSREEGGFASGLWLVF